MNNLNTHNFPFKGAEAGLANFVKSLINALIRAGEWRFVAGDEDSCTG